MHVLAVLKADAVRRDFAIAEDARASADDVDVGSAADDFEVVETATTHVVAVLKVDAMHHYQLIHQLRTEHRSASAQRPKECDNTNTRHQRH